MALRQQPLHTTSVVVDVVAVVVVAVVVVVVVVVVASLDLHYAAAPVGHTVDVVDGAECAAA